MKSVWRYPLILVVLILGLVTLTACGGSSSSSGSSGSAPTADEIKGLIDDDINIIVEQYDQLKTEADSGKLSGADAATLANNGYALINRFDVIKNSLTGDVNAGYITGSEKSDYEVKIAEEQGKLSELVDKLKEESGSDSSMIDPSTKLITVISKDGLDHLISDNEQLIDNLERGVSEAPDDVKVTFENLLSNRLISIKTALDDLKDLESKGIITADERTDYETQIKDLQDRFESLEEELVK